MAAKSESSLVTDTATAPRTTTDRTITTDASQHRVETQHGHKVHVEDVQDRHTETTEDFDARVRAVVDAAQRERQELEDERAVKRNRNRLYILVVVLVMEMIVPTLYGWHLLPALMIKYEVLAITAPDALLTVYAYIKRY